jgi:kynureninase
VLRETTPIGHERARARDAADPLASFRDRFHLPPKTIYLDGNSLGLLSKDSERALLNVLDEWKRLGVGGWLDGDPPWAHYGEELGARVAKLIGAEPDEVVVTESTTVNLHHLTATLYRPDRNRHVIVADPLNFPSDLHAVKGQLLLRGRDPDRSLRLVPSQDGWTIDEGRVEAALGPDVSLLVLPAVLYRSGQWLDMRRLTKAAHEHGALAIWDLSHAVGAVPVELDAVDADGAIWCHYKYLHAGPGATGGIFVRRRHHGLTPALPGWWGQTLARKFEMDPVHQPAPGAARWQIGTIPVLATAPLRGALDLIEAATMHRVREKSVGLTSFLIECLDELLPSGSGVRIVSPRDPARRGGHVAVQCPGRAATLEGNLKERGVVVDVRPPDLLRLAPAPLTTTYEEVWTAVTILREVLEP